MTAVAIVGMACRYPDARSPLELWDNVLAQRRAFRRIPPQRLNVADYCDVDRGVPDRAYVDQAAVIEGYEFDRVRYRVVGSTYRAADPAHWLALDVAGEALADAGFAEGEGLPRRATGVLLGNTLTGEFSRANVMRLRWPYVGRVLAEQLAAEGWSDEQCERFLAKMEERYKRPFPPVGEETLAGGLSNTIAGRICNHFDFKGGGYTVDGACAASLLAVTNACGGLVDGDLDVALAGGVDLSIDPFELVGFAKTGALAPDEMRVYDTRSAGFWPGEGCGFLVLMRHDDAIEQRRRIYAVLRGWGVSSDGSGGITRPDVEGQLLALHRAYRRAGFGIETVGLFEGHGTGTRVGDATELQVLSRARREAGAGAVPVAISSVKANIGHTKAAAGVAGVIKAAMALHCRIVPPATACERPHRLLTEGSPALRVLGKGEPWPNDLPLRAGVSAMGFGGINTHVAIEGTAGEPRRALGPHERSLLRASQDAELFLFAGADAPTILELVEPLLQYADGLARCELADLAAELASRLDRDAPLRAAVVAATPAVLARNLATLRDRLAGGVDARLDIRAGVFVGRPATQPRIGFVFPGQGSPSYRDGGAIGRRFETTGELYDRLALPPDEDDASTTVAQPAIVTASMAALRVLGELGIQASVAAGHSLGELTALHWGGAYDERTLLRIATTRARAMAELGETGGAMASVTATPDETMTVIGDEPVVIAGYNGPRRTVVSGPDEAIDAVIRRAARAGHRCTRLPVSHAFHSPLVAHAAPGLATHLAGERLAGVDRAVASTVTGTLLPDDADTRMLLVDQITSPVRFTEAAHVVITGADLVIEVGPGQVLGDMLREIGADAVVSTDAGGPSLQGLLSAVAAAYALGAPVRHETLFDGRFTRPFDLRWKPKFFANPCELDDEPHDPSSPPSTAPRSESRVAVTPREVLTRLVADRAELPPEAVRDGDRFLSDLHLNSITVGQLMAEAARTLGQTPPADPTGYADATIAEAAEAIGRLAKKTEPAPQLAQQPAGVDTWIRAFSVELKQRHRAIATPRAAEGGGWRVLGPPGHPLEHTLPDALRRNAGGSGVAVCLPPEPDESCVDLLLDAARAAMGRREATRLVLVQHGGGGAAFAKTLHMESPQIATCVVDVPLEHPQAAEWVAAEAASTSGYRETHYDEWGGRSEPVLELLPPDAEPGDLPLDATDVLLVTGGGKGIGAECALTLARETGARLILMGRSNPDDDAELAANIERMTAEGVELRYVAADVTDADAVARAVREGESVYGPVTALLHAAGRNVPRPLTALDRDDFLRTLGPKVRGARNVLAALDPDRLRLLLAFGSIIARIGLYGEADYAVANDWLRRLVQRWQDQHRHCRCLTIEWSVWSGVGMGRRLGRVEALAQRGVTPITTEAGLQLLRGLLGRRPHTTSVIVTGRFGEPPTLAPDRPPLPLLRFLEKPRVNYPGLELIVDSELSNSSDPYLGDHVFRGERMLPAVMGLEAMAQVATTVAGAQRPPVFERVQFTRPVVVAADAQVTVRVAALKRESGVVDVVLRSSESGFQLDHFTATCRFGEHVLEQRSLREAIDREDAVPPVDLDTQRDLYGGLLFQGGRFRRLGAYRRLAARECVAEIRPDTGVDWFGQFLPGTLVIGDPGVRDAAIHAIQCCIPHAALLPVGADRIVPAEGGASGPTRVSARERFRDGDLFVYDLEVLDAGGVVRERWEGLHLRAIEKVTAPDGWAAPLLGPYLQRRIEDQVPGAAVAVEVHASGRRAAWAEEARRRPDGKPVASGSRSSSAAHADDLTLDVSGSGRIGCDMETVVPRSADDWRDMLGSQRFALTELIAREAGEDRDTAATRVWAAHECLKKAGVMLDVPVVFGSSSEDGWVVLGAGRPSITTFAGTVSGRDRPMVIAVLAEGGRSSG